VSLSTSDHRETAPHTTTPHTTTPHTTTPRTTRAAHDPRRTRPAMRTTRDAHDPTCLPRPKIEFEFELDFSQAKPPFSNVASVNDSPV